MIKIRRVDDAEEWIDEVREIERVCLAGREHEAVPVDLVGFDPWLWIASDAGHPIAFGVLVDRGGDPCVEREGWHLRMSGVMPAYGGHGIQKRLVRARVAFARSSGARLVRTYTRPDNAESMRALISCGFRPYRAADPYAGDDFVYWQRKDL